MGPKTIEGTWEEVARRADELAGHRVRVTVIDEREPHDDAHGGARAETAETTAFEAFSRAGLIGCLKGGPDDPADLATNPAHMQGFGDE